MRGSMPDVECPRCSATFVPTFEKLVTCARCALVFTPHEVVHRAPLVEVVVAPPTVRTMTRGDTITVLTRLSRSTGLATLVFLVAFGALVVSNWSALDLIQHLFVVVGGALVLYRAVAQLISYRIVTIDPASFSLEMAPLPLLGAPSAVIARKDVATIFVRERQGKRALRYCVSARIGGSVTDLVVSRQPDVAEYVRDLIAQAWNIPVE